MDAYGGLHPFGGAPVIAGGPYWPNSTQARGLAANPNGPGVWVLDSYGGVHNEGGAPALVSHGYFPNTWMVTGFAILSTGTGGYLTDSHGNVYPIGDAPTVRVAAPTPASGWRRTIAIAALS
jgi:hypothetical protein